MSKPLACNRNFQANAGNTVVAPKERGGGGEKKKGLLIEAENRLLASFTDYTVINVCIGYGHTYAE